MEISLNIEKLLKIAENSLPFGEFLWGVIITTSPFLLIQLLILENKLIR